MEFIKMHGCGNDYVYFDCFKKDISNMNGLTDFIIKISDRHFGIGSDGVILICPSEIADAKMVMYNADGSEGAMCGNGIRCVGKYVYDNNICHKKNISIETKSGIKNLVIDDENGIATYITVDMGAAIIDSKSIPVVCDTDTFIDRNITINSTDYNVTCVSMGNPHAVVFTHNIDDIDIEKIGPLFEHNELFPDRVNTEFIEVIDDHTINFRVWERGSGETMACGTGACASVVAACLNGLCDVDKEIHVILRGGDLFITYKSNGTVLMKGPATLVFKGNI